MLHDALYVLAGALHGFEQISHLGRGFDQRLLQLENARVPFLPEVLRWELDENDVAKTLAYEACKGNAEIGDPRRERSQTHALESHIVALEDAILALPARSIHAALAQVAMVRTHLKECEQTHESLEEHVRVLGSALAAIGAHIGDPSLAEYWCPGKMRP